MQVVADLHLHSKYSRAVSKNMVPRQIATWAAKKGIDLVATGDWTHPLYFRQLQAELEEKGSGVYRLKKKWEVGSEKLDEDVGSGINASHISFQNPPSHFPHLISPFFLLGTELSCIYSQGGRLRRIHLLVFAPSFDVVEQINERLAKFGNLSSDGRPTLSMPSPELVEVLMQIDKNILIYPNHAWTPWFGVFGSKSGFDSMEECYQDQIKNIFALETGLSSDPAMNWRLSSLDKFTLISNSDAHSANVWRIGREVNVFDLEKITYDEIFNVIKYRDKKKFLFTIETDPNLTKSVLTAEEI